MAATNRHVVIAGGSGFLGRGLAGALAGAGYAVTVLSRCDAPEGDWPEGTQWRQWDGRSLGAWRESLDGAAAVVNLVGRSVDCRKTPENRKVILASRVDSCRVLGEAMRAVDRPPAVWIQSATAHIVGDPQPLDKICDESTSPGPQDEIAPRVGVAWERAFEEAKLPEQRGVVLRISFVLGPNGGAMRRLTKVTKLGLGGTVGSGRQWISWIHQEDINQLILAALTDERYSGVYMVTAPNPVTNRRFMQAMRRAYGRPWSPPALAIGVKFACRWLLNTDPELALMGRRCVPTRLTNEHQFPFRYRDVDEAIAAVREAERAADAGRAR